MASWSPKPEHLQRVLQMLRNGLVPDTRVQQQATAELERFSANPEFVRYLVYALAYGPRVQLEPGARLVAGGTLTTVLRKSAASLDAATVHYARTCLVALLGDPEVAIRNAAGSCIATLVRRRGLEQWPELVQHLLMGVARTDNPPLVSGCFLTLCNVCEDDISGVEQLDSRPMPRVLSAMLRFQGHPAAPVREKATKVVTRMVKVQSLALRAEFAAALAALAKLLTSDRDEDVLVAACAEMAAMVDEMFEQLRGSMRSMLPHMLRLCSEGSSYVVARAAMEFWPALVVQLSHLGGPTLMAVKDMVLTPLVPVLMQRAVLVDEDLDGLESEPTDPARLQAGAFAAAAAAAAAGGGAAAPARPAGLGQASGNTGLDEASATWTLRKCAAQTIIKFGEAYGYEFAKLVMAEASRRLTLAGDASWRLRESGICVLGALARGCADELDENGSVMGIARAVLRHAADPRPPVRTVVLWTLGQYAAILLQDHELRLPLVQLVVARMRDPVPAVREAAIVGLSRIAKGADDSIDELLPMLVPACCQLLPHLQCANRQVLMDSLATIADAAGDAMAGSPPAAAGQATPMPYVAQVMMTVGGHWTRLSQGGTDDLDPEVGATLEAVVATANAAGAAFAPYAQGTLDRALKLLDNCHISNAAASQAQEVPPSMEVFAADLDLLDAVVEAVGDAALPQLRAHRNLLDALLFALDADVLSLPSSAASFIGTLATSAPDLLRPKVSQLVAGLQGNCIADYLEACNNALWALANVVVAFRDVIAPALPGMLGKVMPIVHSHTEVGANIRANVGLLVCRIALLAPQLLQPHVSGHLGAIASCAAVNCDGAEKLQCLRGLAGLVNVSPKESLAHFTRVAYCVATVDRIGDDEAAKPACAQQGLALMATFRRHAAGNWMSVLRSLGDALGRRLQATLGRQLADLPA